MSSLTGSNIYFTTYCTAWTHLPRGTPTCLALKRHPGCRGAPSPEHCVPTLETLGAGAGWGLHPPMCPSRNGRTAWSRADLMKGGTINH